MAEHAEYVATTAGSMQPMVNPYPSKTTGTFTVDVGRLVAPRIEREMRRSAFEIGARISIDKHMGWLDGVFLVTVTGESDKVVKFMAGINRWVRHIDGEADA